MRQAKPIADRLFPRIDAEGDCWLWTGARTRYGYGHISRGRRLGAARVHRVVWELLVGPIPDGTELDHVCRIRHCCNPDHLEPVTRAVNVARGSQGGGRPRGSSCRRGHLFTPENTVQTTRQRSCRTCSNAAKKRYRDRQKAGS